MIVLIAPEQDIKNEISILHQLFEAGLTHFHLRKPDKTINDFSKYLNQIDKQYHDKIVVHQHHELINDYLLKGIHFQEKKRRETDLKTLQTIRNRQKTSVSSSFHSTEDIVNCKFDFDYHLLSPVFSSISKKGYKGQGFDVNFINKKIIGMGGVTTKNLPEFTKLGYQGVGVLGGIWQSETPVEDFKTMKRHFE